jgi:hypothetical protein
MITLLLAPLPIALSLLSPSLPELVALALILLITLAMALVLAMAGTFKSAVSYLAETPANRLAMPHFLHKKSRRPAAFLLKQIGPYSSLRHCMNHTRSRRSSRLSRDEAAWFTLAAPVLPLNNQNMTIIQPWWLAPLIIYFISKRT